MKTVYANPSLETFANLQELAGAFPVIAMLGAAVAAMLLARPLTKLFF
jgi:hypothetical protein